MRKRAAYCWLTGASRTVRSRSRGGIRVGWVDIEASLHSDYARNWILRGTDTVSQFASFPRPCPTTSRPRVIPTGNIRQRYSDFSRHISLSKSLLGCRSGIAAEPSHTVATASSASSQGTWTQICSKLITYPPPQSYPGAKYLGAFLVSVRGPHLPTNRFVWEIH